MVVDEVVFWALLFWDNVAVFSSFDLLQLVVSLLSLIGSIHGKNLFSVFVDYLSPSSAVRGLAWVLFDGDEKGNNFWIIEQGNLHLIVWFEFLTFLFPCICIKQIKTSLWKWCTWVRPLMPQQIFTPWLEGFSFKNSSKQFTKKHEPYETPFISLPHPKPPLSCAGDESYKLSVTSALPWNQTKSQLLFVWFSLQRHCSVSTDPWPDNRQGSSLVQRKEPVMDEILLYEKEEADERGHSVDLWRNWTLHGKLQWLPAA